MRTEDDMPNNFDLIQGIAFLTLGILLIIIGSHDDWW